MAIHPTQGETTTRGHDAAPQPKRVILSGQSIVLADGLPRLEHMPPNTDMPEFKLFAEVSVRAIDAQGSRGPAQAWHIIRTQGTPPVPYVYVGPHNPAQQAGYIYSGRLEDVIAVPDNVAQRLSEMENAPYAAFQTTKSAQAEILERERLALGIIPASLGVEGYLGWGTLAVRPDGHIQLNTNAHYQVDLLCADTAQLDASSSAR